VTPQGGPSHGLKNPGIWTTDPIIQTVGPITVAGPLGPAGTTFTDTW
jgi:hypothetical protein